MATSKKIIFYENLDKTLKNANRLIEISKTLPIKAYQKKISHKEYLNIANYLKSQIISAIERLKIFVKDSILQGDMNIETVNETISKLFTAYRCIPDTFLNASNLGKLSCTPDKTNENEIIIEKLEKIKDSLIDLKENNGYLDYDNLMMELSNLNINISIKKDEKIKEEVKKDARKIFYDLIILVSSIALGYVINLEDLKPIVEEVTIELINYGCTSVSLISLIKAIIDAYSLKNKVVKIK